MFDIHFYIFTLNLEYVYFVYFKFGFFWRCQSNERDGDDKNIVQTPSVENGGLSRVERRGL